MSFRRQRLFAEWLFAEWHRLSERIFFAQWSDSQDFEFLLLPNSVVYHDIAYFWIGLRKEKEHGKKESDYTETYIKAFCAFKCILAFQVNQIAAIE